MDNNSLLNLSDFEDTLLDEIIDGDDIIFESETADSERMKKRKRKCHVPLLMLPSIFFV